MLSFCDFATASYLWTSLFLLNLQDMILPKKKNCELDFMTVFSHSIWYSIKSEDLTAGVITWRNILRWVWLVNGKSQKYPGSISPFLGCKFLERLYTKFLGILNIKKKISWSSVSEWVLKHSVSWLPVFFKVKDSQLSCSRWNRSAVQRTQFLSHTWRCARKKASLVMMAGTTCTISMHVMIGHQESSTQQK